MNTFLKVLRIITLVMPVYDAVSKRVRKAREAKQERKDKAMAAKIRAELIEAKSEAMSYKRQGEIRQSYKKRGYHGK
jgi:hypothetical protein